MKTTDSVNFAKALADETRQEILRLCCCDWLSVNEIASQLAVTQPTVSHHLAKLRKAGLVETRSRGKHIYYRLNQKRFVDCCGELVLHFVPEENPRTDSDKGNSPTLLKQQTT